LTRYVGGLRWWCLRTLFDVGDDAYGEDELVVGVVTLAQLYKTRLLALLNQTVDRIIKEQLIGIVAGKHLPSVLQIHRRRMGGDQSNVNTASPVLSISLSSNLAHMVLCLGVATNLHDHLFAERVYSCEGAAVTMLLPVPLSTLAGAVVGVAVFTAHVVGSGLTDSPCLVTMSTADEQRLLLQ